MRIAAVQLTEHAAQATRSAEEVRCAILAAAGEGANLVLLPELGLVGYNAALSHAFSGEAVPGPWTERLVEWARELDLTVIGGLVEKEGNDRYNTLMVVDATGYRGKYRKIHVSTIENAYWARGESAKVIETTVGRIGLGICADMVFPTPWRDYVAQSPDLIAIAAAWPDFRTMKGPFAGRQFREFHCDMTQTIPEKVSRALGVPVVLAACGGSCSHSLPILGVPLQFSFAGGSRVVNGSTVAEVRRSGDFDLATADVDLHRNEPDPSAWEGPWLPTRSAWIRSHFHVGETLSSLAFRPVYHMRRLLRSK